MEGDARHLSVLRQEVVGLLCPTGPKVLVDCTTGLGGHSQALLEAAGPQAQLIAIDLDEQNLRDAKKRLEPFAPRVRFFQANFADVREVLAEVGVPGVDGLVADLGIASTQLDDPMRGLSFTADGPLDMRMDKTQENTAAKLVNTLGEAQLADLIYQFGEERYSRRIARAIVAARTEHTISGTRELAELIVSAYPSVAKRTRHGVHPATRTFQALRIAVNRELDNLDRLLVQLPEVLNPGGRAAVISFHSLEDRRVKHAFADWAASGQARLLTKKPVQPTDEETAQNPRSRSAKLRGVERVL